MNAAQRKLITGGLSKPSKMPGYAYNLPAIHCKTGSKLAQVPGTTCHGCYALKGRVRTWRASQLRYWWMKKREKDLIPNWRSYANIVGPACFVVPATDENIKIMGEILDS